MLSQKRQSVQQGSVLISVALSLAVMFLLALLFPGSVFAADTPGVAGEWLSGSISRLKQWQTLTVGVLALIAAWVAGRAAWAAARAAREQLDFQREESESRQRRRSQACLAVLPVDLSGFIRYLEERYRIAVEARHALRSYEKNRGLAKLTLQALEMPRVPERIITNLQALIEHLDDYNAGIITKVLREYQIQNDRFGGALRFARENCDSVSAPSDMDETFKGTVFLFLLIENMLPFARGERKEIPPFAFSEEKACNALHVLEQILPVEDRIDHDKESIFEYIDKATKFYF